MEAIRASIENLATKTENLVTKTDDLATKTGYLATKTENLVTKTDDLATKTDDLATKTCVVLRAAAQITFQNFNAYDTMTQTSAGLKKGNEEKLRKEYFDHCGITSDEGDAKANGKAHALCLLTKRNGKLKLAHILPASTHKRIRDVLQITDEDIWSFRNVLLLSENTEKAFDRNQLSFVPHPLLLNQYVLKFWDESVKKEEIWNGAKQLNVENDNLIGFYEGLPLNLRMENGVHLVPFKRCLSYQNFICFFKSKLSTHFVPDDFSSVLGEPNGWKIQRDDFLLMRADLDKDIVSETAEDD